MSDYPRFPRIRPNMSDSSTTFTTGSPQQVAAGPPIPAPKTTVSFLGAGTANAAAQDALTQMEQWGDSLNDKLSSDGVKIRNSVQQDQFGSCCTLLRIFTWSADSLSFSESAHCSI